MTRLGCCLIVFCGASLALVAQQTRPSTPAPPQQQGRLPAPRTTGLIAGRVVDGASGKPVSGAVVSLDGGTAIPLPPNTPPPAQPNTPPPGVARSFMLTNGDGQFVFRSLTRGRYNLSASAAGYVDAAYGQRRPGGPSSQVTLADNQRLGEVKIVIWQQAVISGTVLDESGEPVVNTAVRVLRRVTNGNRRRFVSGTQTRTDDRGVYRLGKLTPGDFVVFVPSTQTTMPASVSDFYQQASNAGGGAAQALNALLNASRAPTPNTAGVQFDAFRLQVNGINGPVLNSDASTRDRVFVYPTTYYPAALTVNQATQLTVGSGEEKTNIDLQLRPLPAGRVSGVVTGPDGPASSLGLRLLPLGTDESMSDAALDAAVTVTDAQGSFTFLGVPQGRYTLRGQIVPAQSQGRQGAPPPPAGGRGRGGAVQIPQMPKQVLWVESPVVVGDADVDGLALALRPGVNISGRLDFSGSAPPPTSSQLQQITISVSFADPQGGASAPQAARVNADGTFTIQGAIPARYLFPNISTGGWVLRDVRLGGRDVSEVPMEVASQDVSGLVVSFMPQSQQTQATGTVHDGMTTVSDDVQVVAFPADYSSWLDNGMSGRRMRLTRTGPNGGYRINGLPPGDYLIAAMKQDDAAEWPDAAFVQVLARVATRFSISEAERKSLDLTTVHVK